MSDEMSDHNQTPAHKFIATINSQIFNRIIRGDYHYENDLRALTRYRKQAQRLESVDLEANILNTIAVMESIAGNSEQSLILLDEVYNLYQQTNNFTWMACTLANSSIVYMTRGELDKSHRMLSDALADMEKADDSQSVHYYNIHRFLLSLQLRLAFVREDYETIDKGFAEVEALLNQFVKSRKSDYARYMAEIYRFVAERELVRDDFEQAHTYINLATEFAEGLELTFELAEIYATHAHIAMKEGAEPKTIQRHWQKMNGLLDGLTSPSHIGRHYLEEARYMQRHQHVDKAKEFARKALEIFKTHQLLSDIEVAEAFLAG